MRTQPSYRSATSSATTCPEFSHLEVACVAVQLVYVPAEVGIPQQQGDLPVRDASIQILKSMQLLHPPLPRPCHGGSNHILCMVPACLTFSPGCSSAAAQAPLPWPCQSSRHQTPPPCPRAACQSPLATCIMQTHHSKMARGIMPGACSCLTGNIRQDHRQVFSIPGMCSAGSISTVKSGPSYTSPGHLQPGTPEVAGPAHERVPRVADLSAL